MPVIAHETGQRPVFPDYDALLPKFTGPLLPLNLERYRRGLIANGLEGQAKVFARASARFQLTQYKAEHEAMLRTRGYAGYQLLMLNDFTGQSEALVGILDPFWETKGVVSAADVRAWNAPTVVLARFPKFVWTSTESFQAEIQIAHFGTEALPAGPLHWSMKSAGGVVFAGGEVAAPRASAGSVTELGVITAPFDRIDRASALAFTVRFAGVENHWNVWVYPAEGDEAEPAGALVTRTLDDTALQALKDGRKVLVLAHGVKNTHAARTGFESVYWSAGWWGNKFSSLGVVCDPKHPALAQFPNEGCSDWQWRDLCAGATAFDLEGAPAGLQPIVQPVPDFHYNARLAHVFEVKVGKGSLLVCGYDLQSNLEKRPAARQFRRSVLRYVAGNEFKPTAEVALGWLERRCGSAGLARRGAKILRVDSEDQVNGNLAANILDGDPSTFWHTRWQPQSDPMPHEVVVDLGREMTLQGVTLLPRQDQPNGRIAQAEIFAGIRADDWGVPKADVSSGQDSAGVQTVRFKQPVTARYLRLVVKAEVSGQSFAALAELDLLQDD